METNNVQFYTLECITHLHAGSGDEAYDYIDKRVQKDPITGWPCINSSSLKGALREHFVQNYWKEIPHGKGVVSDPNTLKVFGSSVDEDEKKTTQGQYSFISCQLLSIPIRSDLRPYYLATCPAIAREILRQTSLSGVELAGQDKDALKKLAGLESGTFVVNSPQPKYLEDWEIDNTAPTSWTPEIKAALEKMLGAPLAVLTDAQFGLFMEALPVVARNQLENGESKNLWYEEIVPRQARFWTLVIPPSDPVTAFSDKLKEDTIQIGGNATIGYGLTKFQPYQPL